MEMAFSDMYSGQMPTAGRSAMSSPRPPSVAHWVRMVRTRELSTQEPTCSTGGMPIASHTSRRPGPALAMSSGRR